VKFIKDQLGDSVRIIANGNIISRTDALDNLSSTGADGVMSAEGILDNPTLFASEELLTQHGHPSPLQIAMEYLDCATRFGPVKMKSVVFHIRRICKQEFEKYSLLEDCVAATNIDQVRAVVTEALGFHTGTTPFQPNLQRQKRAKEALARRKQEESKRKQFEERMIRKAKREGLTDLFHYLNQGATNPTTEELDLLKSLPKEEAFAIWKERFSQHCYAFHFAADSCTRDRKCAFLHADPRVSEAEVFG
jgi:tRNA-dihydrouridine synthase 1